MPHVTDGPGFGRQLHALRRQNGVTQEELAAALGQRSDPTSSLIDDWHAWIAAVEQGRIPIVEPMMVVTVALALHVPASALFPSPVLDGPLPTIREQLQAKGLSAEEIQAFGQCVDLDERSAFIMCNTEDLAQ